VWTCTTAWTLVDKRLRPRTPAAVALAPAGVSTGGASIADATAPPAAPGTRARTGEACPASGWWRCEESNALDGTRWFARGALLPAATFQVPAGVFAKSAGPELIQRRSGWQLMRQADASVLRLDGPPALV